MQSIICLYMVKFVMLQRSHIAGKNLPSRDIFFIPENRKFALKMLLVVGFCF